MNMPPLFVLAGGFGTRLRSAVPDLPKPLAPIGSEPFLKYQIHNWIQQGVTHIVILIHYQSLKIIEFLQGERVNWPHIRIDFLVEPEPMGTGGAINFALKHFPFNIFFVSNADTWLGTGFSDLLSRDANSLAIKKLNKNILNRYGLVTIDHKCLIVDFDEKSNKSQYDRFINTGLSLLSRDCFNDNHENIFSLEKDVYPRLAGQGLLKGIEIFTDFIDIGIPDDYHRFCSWMHSQKNFQL